MFEFPEKDHFDKEIFALGAHCLRKTSFNRLWDKLFKRAGDIALEYSHH